MRRRVWSRFVSWFRQVYRGGRTLLGEQSAGTQSSARLDPIALRPRTSRSGRPLFRPFRLEALEPRQAVSTLITFSIGSNQCSVTVNPDQSIALACDQSGAVTVNGQTVAYGSGNLAAAGVTSISITDPDSGFINLSELTASQFTSLTYDHINIYSTYPSLSVGDGQIGGTLWAQGSGSGAYYMSGGAGTDVLNGYNYDTNVLYGGSGHETLNAGSGTNTLYGGSGYNTLNGAGSGYNTLNAYGGTNILNAGSYYNTLNSYSSSATNTLTGGIGYNTLNAVYGGSNLLVGGAGVNTLNATSGGTNTLRGGSGSNTLNDVGGGNNTLFGGTGYNTINVGSSGSGSGSGSGSHVDTLNGGAGPNTINSYLPAYNTLNAGAGSNTINAYSGGTNTLNGATGTGNDTIIANGGANTLVGGPGYNSLSDSGAGYDVLQGGGVSNVLNAGAGSNVLYGNQGVNTLYGHGGYNSLLGAGGTDTLYGTGGGWNYLSASGSTFAITGSSSGYSLTNTMSGAAALDVNVPASGNTAFLLGAHDTLIGPASPLSTGYANHLSLTKDGAGTQAVVGTNVFDGPTTINSGTLWLAPSSGSNSSLLGNTPIAVNPGATLAVGVGYGWNAGSAGTGSAGASLALGSGAILNLAASGSGSALNNSSGGFTLTLRQGTNFAGPSLSVGGATLDFALGTAAATQLITTGAATVTDANTINIGVVSNSLTPGATYTLISAASGLTGAFYFANGTTQQMVLVGGQFYSLSLVNTDTALAVSIALAAPQFAWPTAPNDGSVALPDDAAQPQPPAAPTYSGDTFDHTQDATYQATAAADQQFANPPTAQDPRQIYQNAVATAAGNQTSSDAVAQQSYQSRVTTALATYQSTIASEQSPGSPQTVDSQAAQALSDAQSADQQKYLTDTGAASSQEQTDLGTLRTNESAEITAVDSQLSGDAMRQAEDAIVSRYLPLYRGVLDTYNQAIDADAHTKATKDADAQWTFDQANDAFVRDQDKLAPGQNLANWSTTLGAEKQLSKDLATAAEALAEAKAADAKRYARDVADAARIRDKSLADAQFTHDSAVAQAKADAFSRWASSVATPGADPSAVAWASYQSSLAANENANQQAVAGLAKTQAYAKAEDAWTEAYAVADTKSSQSIHDAQAEQSRTNQIATALATLETGLKAAETGRDWDASQATITASMDDAWCTYEVAIARAKHDYAKTIADNTQIDADKDAVDADAASAYVQRYNNGSVDADFVAAYNLAFAKAQHTHSYDTLDGTLDTETATQTQNNAGIDALNAYEHSANAAFAGASTTVSALYAAFETALGRAQDTFNSALAGDARTQAVDQAKAEAGQLFSDAQADAQFTGGDGTSSNPGEAALADARTLADANCKLNFEVGQATAYQSAVSTWAAGRGRWGTYQVALATDALTQVTTVDNAAISQATSLATDDAASTQSTVAHQITYATALYGSATGGGAYVARAQHIADGAYTAATQTNAQGQGPLEAYASAQATAVSSHDTQVAAASLLLLNQIADANATHDKAVNDADYTQRSADDQSRFDYTDSNSNNQIDYATWRQQVDAHQQTYASAVAGDDQQRINTIAADESAWATHASQLNVSLVTDWATAQSNFAQAQAAASIVAATAVAQGEQTYQDADALATKIQSKADADAAQTLDIATATDNAGYARSAANAAGAQSLADTIARNNYETGLSADHVTAMLAAYNGDPAHTPLELYQYEVAQADSAQATADAAARLSQANQLYGAGQAGSPQGADIVEAQAIYAASTAAATREAAANHTSDYASADDEYQLTTQQDAADAALYIAQTSATANLPAAVAAIEQQTDARYSADIKKRDDALAADAVLYDQQIASAYHDYQTQKAADGDPTGSESRTYLAAAETAQQIKTASDQTANATLATDIAHDAGEQQTNFGPARQQYVDQIYAARVTFVHDSNQAQETYAQHEAAADLQLAGDMASSDDQHLQDTTAANATDAAAHQNQEAALESQLAGDTVADATGRAIAEAAYQTTIANGAATAAANLAAAAPGDANLAYTAAVASGQAAFVASLATIAAGQSQSPFVLYQTAQAQAAADSQSQAAIASAWLTNQQAAATDAYNLAMANQEQIRSVSLAQVRDGGTTASDPGSDLTQLQNQDALALSTARSDRTQANDYLSADLTYNGAVQSDNARAENDPTYTASQLNSDLAQAKFVRDEALATADFGWRSRAAADELTLALAQAGHDQAATTGEAAAQRDYSLGVASAQQTEDQTNAGVQSQHMRDQTAADNTQLTEDATANAAFQTTSQTANVAAFNAVQSSLQTRLPAATNWAQFQTQQALAEQTAWSTTLLPNYLASQQQSAAAYTAYASAQSTAYASAAGGEATQNYNYSTYAAAQVYQEAVTVAGKEYTYATALANTVNAYRTTDAAADQTYANALATDARDNLSTSADHNTWVGVTDQSTGSAASTYQSAYIALDAARRHDIAQAGLTLEQNLTSHAESAASLIAADQATFDTTVASDYYVAPSGSTPAAGLEGTLGSLQNTYANQYWSAIAAAVGNLATGNPSAAWHTIAAQYSAVEQVQSAAAITQAATDEQTSFTNAASADAANISDGQTARSDWLSDLSTSDGQLLTTAQTTLSTATVGGDASQVAAPTDLVPPTPDIGAEPQLAITPEYVLGNNHSPVGTGWLGIYSGSITGSTNYLNQYTIQSWDNYGGWLASNQTPSATYPMWSASSIVAHPSSNNLFDSGISAVPTENGPAALSFGAGRSYVYAYGGLNYSWDYRGWTTYTTTIASLSGLLPTASQTPSAAPQASPTTAVTPELQQERTSLDGLRAVVALSRIGLDALKEVDPLGFNGATRALLNAGVGFAAMQTGGTAAAQPKTQRPSQSDFSLACEIREFGPLPQAANPEDENYWSPEEQSQWAEEIYAAGRLYGMSSDGSPPDNLPRDAWSAAKKFNEYHADKWDGRTILQIIAAYERNTLNSPKAASEIEQLVSRQVVLVRASSEPNGWFFKGAAHPTAPQITVLGFYNKPLITIKDFSGPAESHSAKIVVGIPDNWTSTQVAQFVLDQFYSNQVVAQILQDAAITTRYPEVAAAVDQATFGQAAKQAGELAGSYYKTIASFIPGAGVSLVIFDVGEGNLSGAALDLVLTTPVGELLGHAAGAITVKIAGVAHDVPVALLKKLEALAPDVKASLLSDIRLAKNEEEAAAAFKQVLDNPVLRDVELASGDVEKWIADLPTRRAPTTRPGQFQRKYAGDVERLISGGGAKFYADGIEGSKIIETKLVTDPARSPFISGSGIPNNVRAKIVGEVNDEFFRMSKILKDPSTPLKSVEVIVSDERAVAFFENLMEKYNIQGNVVVKPE